jgi:hypothetical protein
MQTGRARDRPSRGERSRSRALRPWFVASAFALALPASARADESTQSAEALFQRARERMGQGDFATACPMLEQSYSLDHGAGTLLALAICHEGAGKPALALREFRESLSVAVRANRPDRVMLAESHVQALEASVPRIQVHPPTPEPAGLELTLDGVAIDRATMLAGVPVDPGPHVIEARTPSAPPWHAQVDVDTMSTPVVIDVPELGAPVAPGSVPDGGLGPGSSTLHTSGWIAGGLGVAAAAVGAGFGIAAFDAEARSRSACHGNLCSSSGVDLNHEARRDAVVSDVTFAVGGVALAGAIFLLTRGRSSSTADSAAPTAHTATHPLRLRIDASARGADLGITGSW